MYNKKDFIKSLSVLNEDTKIYLAYKYNEENNIIIDYFFTETYFDNNINDIADWIFKNHKQVYNDILMDFKHNINYSGIDIYFN